ncbi:hypothetical protein CTI12_AA206730 [Artemisia annua]|uniref:Uncharacterized protein n=1 Tax=Artemisia annua TaxID=35608 RepID=A0A2U1NY78_ARTAN|nr:hypothetical protein CTI12_AA206730 [Artemisia annua]
MRNPNRVEKELGDLPKSMYATVKNPFSQLKCELCSAYSAFLPKDEATLTPFPQEASTDPEDKTVTQASKKAKCD